MKALHVSAVAAFVLLSACGNVEAEEQRLRADRAELMYHRLSEKVDDMDDAVSDLRTQVDRLDREDWSAVVPALKWSVDEVEAASQGASYEAAP
ncbi:hypothetical protein BV98_001888 [Sphingobium herbicidovorans NBRC 16415]|uniref:Lipoprotein n=1 Tax=Sphingobium herbicidovorans (strain ATCC 700291 / DSM 11019 / CCUG 56400 / KCTC 2939 / LMG 18315 / NBRC 16415 / MH) TaxID=1219045 RepID=A0A086PBB5_SPHHM|nr:hypothetical protein [Sphingobium herbicidovorans]KFG90683.1 hypothetical protein BV98_001888 [Sphingobium herbicidovorans NBRC 16415]